MTEKVARMNGRHDRIVEFVGARGEASVQELADRFGVSLMTVRRDLMLLEEGGRVTRTHGGAILTRPGVVAFSFQERGDRCAAEKRAIAEAAARMIKPGSTVALDSGTTTLEVAITLQRRELIRGKLPGVTRAPACGNWWSMHR